MLIVLALGVFFAVLATRVAARRSLQRFRDSGDAFRCRLRVRCHRSAIWPALGRRWSRPMWALWEDDVLLVRRGPVFARDIPLRTQSPVDGVHSLVFEAPRLCGRTPLGVVLRIWDGSLIEVAASTEDRMKVVGPYMAAAINDLPQAPVPRRRT
ncbi:hypothetical protein ACPCHT_08870 [Nucisporomicrobium flavum]|uniref:hypothetical protein n=1 Tax=Nucisporomicrobium flavum TaxID=2785915 RepID=UPI0018F3E646|nr:hypothetical protein [Nucisporomicrobium flavum]